MDSNQVYNSYNDWIKDTVKENLTNKILGLSAKPSLSWDKEHNSSDKFLLTPYSPMIDKGINLKKFFEIDHGSIDFYGNKIPSGKEYDIGAHEWSN